MQLVFSQEGEPAYAVELVLSELGVDLHRNLVLLHFASIQQLSKELTLLIPASEKVFREVGRIRKSSLQLNDEHDRRCDDTSYPRTSRGTILTKEANVFVAVDLVSSSESLIRPRTGTIMKMT